MFLGGRIVYLYRFFGKDPVHRPFFELRVLRDDLFEKYKRRGFPQLNTILYGIYEDLSEQTHNCKLIFACPDRISSDSSDRCKIVAEKSFDTGRFD